MTTGIPLPSEVIRPRRAYYLGERSTAIGGYWHKCRLPPEGSCPVSSEPDSVLNGLPGVWSNIARARYEDMWHRATLGALKLGKHDDVGEIRRKPPILLELRVQINPEAAEAAKRFLLRLYFAEPKDHPKLMLALHFARKPSGEDRDGAQDRQISVAHGRHCRGQQNSFDWGLEKIADTAQKEEVDATGS